MRRSDRRNDPPKGPRHAAASRVFYLIAAAALSGSCEDPMVLGVRAHELRDMLLAGDRSLDPVRPAGDVLAELARLGPGALYYAARAAGPGGGDREREAVLLDLASRKEAGLFRRRAWELLPESPLPAAATGPGLLAFSERQAEAGIDAYLPRRATGGSPGRPGPPAAKPGPSWTPWPRHSPRRPRRTRPSSRASGCGPPSRSRGSRRPHPAAVRPGPTPGRRISRPPWPPLEAPGADGSGSPPSPGELALFRLRLQVALKDYGAAYRALVSGRFPPEPLPAPGLSCGRGESLHSTPPPSTEGIAALSALESAVDEAEAGGAAAGAASAAGIPISGKPGSLRCLYRARMLGRAERRAEAARGLRPGLGAGAIRGGPGRRGLVPGGQPPSRFPRRSRRLARPLRRLLARPGVLRGRGGAPGPGGPPGPGRRDPVHPPDRGGAAHEPGRAARLVYLSGRAAEPG
ncbi:MAG: hypothetical protein M0C28_25775 [Candidatus Moduliflexus flocculans]|nr:hypothetical protein [Candidatus Moduliflexus flocculans]